MSKEWFYIERCRECIEEKVGWGSSDEWQNQDFEILSQRIFTETRVSLSVSTLKRIWGKVKYDGSPNLATLNALAEFAGFENWRAFTTNLSWAKKKKIPELQQKRKSGFQYFRIVKWAIPVLAIGLVSVVLWREESITKKLQFSNVTFSSRSVTKGVPNTVIFQYNIQSTNADSVFIQQSWDQRRRFRVDKNKQEFTSTYYVPGYYRAKLVLNDSIVKEHDILIETQGWLATLDNQPIPVYLREEEIRKDDVLRIPTEFLTANRIEPVYKKWINFYRVAKEEKVSSAAFHAEFEIRNTFHKNSGVCQVSQIVLLATNGVISIPLSAKGCVGDLDLVVGDKMIDGQTHDLSAFGVDYTNWIRVSALASNNQIRVLVNDSLAHENDSFKSIGDIVGMRIGFMGLGEVKRAVVGRYPQKE